MEAMKQGSTTIGLRSKTHVVLECVNKANSELSSLQKKIFKVDDHIGVAIAELTTDGRILSRYMRSECINYNFTYDSPLPVGRLVVQLADKAQVPFARSSLNHDDIFILDTKSKKFQFNGSNSSIQERAKALEVVQYIKDSHHHGKCEVAAIGDGKLMADANTGEFWGFFGGFAPLPRKTANDDNMAVDAHATKLFWVEKGQAKPVEADSLTRKLLDTNRCYLLDCGAELFVWMGRTTTLDERKSAIVAAEELLHGFNRPKSHIIRMIEGFEIVLFRSKFDSWPQTTVVAVTEDGRGKVDALLERQGVNVKGLLKVAPAKEYPQPYIACTGNLQVLWGKVLKDKHLLSEYYVEDGHTLHLVARQPTQSQPSAGTSSGEMDANNGNDASAGGPRNRVGQISHSVVLRTFNVGDQGEGGVMDLGQAIGVVLNSFGIGGQSTTIASGTTQSSGVPRGPGGFREYMGRGPPPGSRRCFNCGLDGHWARDCKAGDWKNKCYH